MVIRTRVRCVCTQASCVWLNSACMECMEAGSVQAAMNATNHTIDCNLTVQRHVCLSRHNALCAHMCGICGLLMCSGLHGMSSCALIPQLTVPRLCRTLRRQR